MEVWFLVALVAASAILWLSLRQIEKQAGSFRDELLRSRQDTQTALTTQIGQLTQSFNQQLIDVRNALQKGLADAGQLTAQAQENVGHRLAEATRLVTEVGQQLGGLQEAGHELLTTAKTLESVLSGARTRGSLGEVALDRLLADTLGQERYELQYRFQSGSVVDAVVKLGDKLLPIDSKFPLDAYRRIVEVAEGEGRDSALKEFARAVRGHVDTIAEKYILPGEGTLELALMFVASESVYYEVLRTQDNRGSVADYCRDRRVIPVSPNTLYAYLAVILMGLRGLQVEENARHLLGHLSGLEGELQALSETHAKVGAHLKNAAQSHAEASVKLERLERSLTSLAHGVLPETPETEVIEPKGA
ncbi:MAG: DNA recombination protein RmuC [Candidatus Acidiferrales bacterium]